ncbi:MAG TPA: PQQ-binding-like beta-propeller repeat protein, partial [Chloroflexia bacterium]|nr:PQQ-binding-like beta-propeller repeat protein [Chloroflexia bacterium]
MLPRNTLNRRLLAVLTAFGLLFTFSAGLYAPRVTIAGAPVGRTTSPGQATRASAVDPGDWPTYGHDNSRTNFNPAENTIGSANASLLVQRWQYNVGTNGTPTSGAPSVYNGVVYVPSSAASPANNLFALDAVNGSQVWAMAAGYRSSCFNVGIGSTPAISATTLVIGADSSDSNPSYYGRDTATGGQVWRNPMGVGASGFPWASPLISGNTAYVGMASRCDNPSVRGEVRALNLTTGVQTANHYFVPAGTAGGGVWNSPALSPDGSILAVATGEDYSCGSNCQETRAMAALDPNTLQVLGYRQEGPPNVDSDFGTTPVIFSDNLGRTLVGANHKNGVFYAYVLNNISAGAIWSRSTGTSVGMMPAYDPTFGSGGTLFIYGSSSRLYAVDPATGADRWPSVVTGPSHGNMAIANRLIFLNTGTNGLQIRGETTGSLIWTLTPPNAGAANSGVAVSHGFIYWLSGSYLNAWALPVTTPTVPANTSTPTTAATATLTQVPVSTSTRTPSATPSRTPTIAPSIIPTEFTSTPTPSNTAGLTVTVVPSSTATGTGTAGPTQTTPPSSTTAPTSTLVATSTSVPTATSCPIQFSDVDPTNTFYASIRCLACRGIVSGYSDGTFRPNVQVTRGQLAKIVSNSAGFNDA